jgi:menaquinone-dependent protoporphyrinogen oxidase
MKTLIIYTSKHGSTEKIASYMKDKLQCDTVNLLNHQCPELEDYEQVIIGGSIYYNSINPAITELIEEKLDLLLTKRVALFLVCLMSEESAAEQFNNNYSEQLLNHSTADGFFGGILQQQELNPIEKVVTSFVFKNVNVNDDIYYDEVDRFIEALIIEDKVNS